MPARSAQSPIRGAASTTSRAALELTAPSQNVLSILSSPAAQYCLKNTGKNPAMTVVANAELPQSYSAQPHCARSKPIRS